VKTRLLPSLFIAGVAAASLIAFAVTGGSLVAGLVPVGAVLFGWILARAPLHRLAYGLLFIALVLDDPRGNPAAGMWKNPLYFTSRVLFDNLNNVVGIEALRFAAVEVLVAALLIVLLLRTMGRPALRVPGPLGLATTLATLCVIGLWVYGLGRGGDFKASLWQIRQLLWIGPITWIFHLSLRGRDDLAPLARVVLAAAVVKAMEALWLYFVICRPMGVRPQYANTHSDTVLYVVAVAILLVGLLEIRTLRAAELAALFLPLFGLGILINNRRLAFVSLAASIALAYVLIPPNRLKTRLRSLAVVATPLLLAYLALGWRSSSTFFLPAAKVASMFSTQDRSALTRDIENWNLVQTYKDRPIFGHGFGHEYFEINKADSVKELFPLYLYIAHNSVLWQWTLGGLVGFTLLWMPFVLTAFFAIRAYRAAPQGPVRAGALVCASVVVAHVIQQYGDMGTQAWLGAFLFGAASAMAGKLAVESGAWPDRASAQEGAWSLSGWRARGTPWGSRSGRSVGTASPSGGRGRSVGTASPSGGRGRSVGTASPSGGRARVEPSGSAS